MARENLEEKIQRCMVNLGCSREEAEDIVKWDKVIDQGGRTPFDLDPETEKMAKKMANATERKKPTNYDFSKRERKANPTKGGIIAEIAQFLAENSQFATENVEITNKERMIAFKIGEDSFEITLIQKRKPKN
jgi:hypothetical protein